MREPKSRLTVLHWQRELKDRTARGSRTNRDGAAVCLYNGLDYCQPQPASACSRGARRIGAIESLEDSPALVHRYAWTRIGDTYAHKPSIHRTLNLNLSSRWGMMKCIIKQIEEDLGDSVAIG